MTRHRMGLLPRHERRRPSRPAFVAGVLGALVAVSATTAPARSAPGGEAGVPDTECPAAATVASVAPEDPVTGWTVSKGTTPEPFEGEVLGVLEDAVSPGFPLIVARLTSPEIDRVGGIWSGMSGSPVYDSSGNLLGAVAYGFAYSPSPVAGITPAEEMQALLSEPPTAAASSPLATAAGRERIDLPGTMERRLVASGAATAAEVSGGLTRLPIALAVPGTVPKKRLAATLERMGMDGVRVFATGSAAPSSPDYPIVSGGNLAVSESYGDVTFAGVGTATAVCGDEILAFGHPFAFTGKSALTMHGASAVYVQEDPNWVPFKMSRLGAPSGTVTQDRMAGLLATQTAIPSAPDITTSVTSGTRGRTGTTYIPARNWFADVSAYHLLFNQERVFDAHAEGAQTSSWTVKGLRADGSAFDYTRADRFAHPDDLVWSAPDELFMQLFKLMNTGERISFTEVDASSAMSPDYQAYAIKKVEIRRDGEWRRVPRPLQVRPGVTKKFRVTLTSDQLPDRYVRLPVTVPRSAVGEGYLTFRGGNTYGGWEEFWYDPTSGSSFDKELAKIKATPRNDTVVADLQVARRSGGAATRSVRVGTGAVVDGFRSASLVVRR